MGNDNISVSKEQQRPECCKRSLRFLNYLKTKELHALGFEECMSDDGN